MTFRRTSSADTASRFRLLRAQRTEPLPEPEPMPTPPCLPKSPNHERMPITPQQIRQLRDRAQRDGDRLFARVCERALRGDTDAINACKAAIWGLR